MLDFEGQVYCTDDVMEAHLPIAHARCGLVPRTAIMLRMYRYDLLARLKPLVEFFPPEAQLRLLRSPIVKLFLIGN